MLLWSDLIVIFCRPFRKIFRVVCGENARQVTKKNGITFVLRTTSLFSDLLYRESDIRQTHHISLKPLLNIWMSLPCIGWLFTRSVLSRNLHTNKIKLIGMNFAPLINRLKLLIVMISLHALYTTLQKTFQTDIFIFEWCFNKTTCMYLCCSKER